jgi:quercetin dioxygenase-like cupin family protein
MEAVMHDCTRSIVLALTVAVFTVLGVASAAAAAGVATPHVKVVKLDPGDSTDFVLLGGPPETGSMRSGLVTLAPGAAVGKHTTGKNEEMLVPLEGEGELRITGQPPIHIAPGLITYAPAHTEHNVVNTGTGRLRYIFIVARAE